MKECIGISGKLFGHKYETVYEVKSNPPSLDEARQLTSALSKTLSPIEYYMNSNVPISSSVSQRHNEIESYNNRVQAIINGRGKEDRKPLYQVCCRCGDRIDLR